MISQLIIFLVLANVQVTPQYYGKVIPEDSIDTNIFILATDILLSPLVLGETSIDTAVFHTEYLPPVGSQGSQNSCVGWAVGYYYKTWQEKKKRNWDLYYSAHRFSPTFIYTQCNGGKDRGMGMSDAFQVLMRQGCASLATCPYSSDYNSWPSRNAYLEAMNYETEELFALPQQYDIEGVNALRQLILNGEIGVMAIDTYQSFHNLNSSNCDYCLAVPPGLHGMSHAITIVGFDDGRITPDGVGAFLCVNSWGTGWGCDGYFWLTYQLFMSSSRHHSPIYYAQNKSDYTPRIIVNVNLSHHSSGNVDISVALGDPGYPAILKEWNAALIYFSPVTDLKSFPSYDIPIDISDFNPLLGTSIHTVSVVIRDHYEDTYSGWAYKGCTDFYAGSGLFYCSPYVPQQIPDYGSAFLPIHVPTTSTAINDFHVEAKYNKVDLTWSCEAPQELNGFNIYRSDVNGGDFVKANPGMLTADFQNHFTDDDVARGGTYNYRVGAVIGGTEVFSDALSITVPGEQTRLHQNYPNPFNPSTTIRFELEKENDVRLSIITIEGKIVRKMISEKMQEGMHSVVWDGKNEAGGDVKSGVYFYRLEAGKIRLTRKLLLIR